MTRSLWLGKCTPAVIYHGPTPLPWRSSACTLLQYTHCFLRGTVAVSYAQAQVLVEPQWLESHLGDPSLAVVETDVDPGFYQRGHIPGAILWDLHKELEDQVTRDLPSPEQMEGLLSRSGISPDTTIVLYGDGNNRSATWAFWLLKYYQHPDVRLLNGGRVRWEKEGRPLTTQVPQPRPTRYRIQGTDPSLRATRDFILARLKSPGLRLVDVRTDKEYRGEEDPAHPQIGIQRLGHIPGAVHLPWERAAQEDGSFLPAEELARMYQEHQVTPQDDVVAYCRLGVRASYTWFVLKYLLGYPKVRVYDGSWTEWGNLVGAPIER